MSALFGAIPAAEIGIDFFLDKAIASGRIHILSGGLVDLDEPGIRASLEDEHRALLTAHGMDRLDISAARSRQRPVTQAIGYSLYSKGAAGVLYGSNVDNQRCFALFEGRSELKPLTEPEPLIDLLAEIEPFLEACRLRIKYP